jgi:hypothetical protein
VWTLPDGSYLCLPGWSRFLLRRDTAS